MKVGPRFYISWLFSALTMFIMFYVWHSIFLNDFKRIQFPITWFVTFAAFSYLLIGAGMFFLFESRLLKRFDVIFVRALVCGIISGLCLFMVATVLHISLTKHLSKQHLLLELTWQLSEQTMGALMLLLMKVLIRDHVPREI